MKTNNNPEEGAKIQPPSKEELIAMMREQIEVRSLQLQLQELNTKLLTSQAEELRAMAFIAQMKAPAPDNPYEGGIPHTLTEEDMENNPDLKEQGLKPGDEVIIDDDQPKRSLKKQ